VLLFLVMPPPNYSLINPCQFSTLIDLLLRSDECINIPLELGLQIRQIDRQEVLVHVQFESVEMEQWMQVFRKVDLMQPRLWRKAAWVNSLDKFKKDKAESDLRRKESFAMQENIRIVSIALSKKFRVPPELMVEISVKMLKEKRWEALQQLGIDTNKLEKV
jgi:hypothetical protein